MKAALLLILCLLTGCHTQSKRQSECFGGHLEKGSPEIILSASWIGGRAALTVRLSIRNLTNQTLAVKTGSILGGVTYPGALLTFKLVQQDGNRPDIFCSGCAPVAIFGSPPKPYLLCLNSGQTGTIDIRLQDLFYLRSGFEHRLNWRDDAGSLLIIGLPGQYTGPASWIGYAEAVIKLL